MVYRKIFIQIGSRLNEYEWPLRPHDPIQLLKVPILTYRDPKAAVPQCESIVLLNNEINLSN